MSAIATTLKSSAPALAGSLLENETSSLRRFVESPLRRGAEIARENTVVILKQSTLEYTCAKRGISLAELTAEYAMSERGRGIIASHRRQEEAIAGMHSIFSPEQILPRQAAGVVDLSTYDLVIALGGDNHFQYVAGFIKDDTPILGISSDLVKSTGALLHRSPDFGRALLERVFRGDYRIESWTKARMRIGDRAIGSAISEIMLAEEKRAKMSAQVVEVITPDGVRGPVEQRGSGLLIATGAGSKAAAWYASASRERGAAQVEFSPGTPELRYVLTEANFATIEYAARHPELPGPQGVLRPGEILRVSSLNRSRGVALLDSLEEEPFEAGVAVDIDIDPQVLRVICDERQ